MAAYASISRRKTGRMPKAPARKMGTWKLAYADFLTALMAFFLIMWLVTGLSQAEREGVAEYFSGAEHMSGTQPQDTRAPAFLLQTRILEDPAYAELGSNARVTHSRDEVRIELMDTARRPLFITGSGDLNAAGQSVIMAAGRLLADQPWPLRIEGHTDRFPSTVQDYSNWELSSDRANAARRALVEAGISEARIRSVAGLSDTVPLKPGQPHLPVNRRISIVINIAD